MTTHQYLQCDFHGCDHREEAPDYGPHLIGKRCPQCGANLLTREDFDGFEPLRLMMDALESAGLTSSEAISSHAIALDLRHHNGKSVVSIEPRKPSEGSE